MTRTELAAAVNQAIDELFPDQNNKADEVDGRWIGALERGDHSWPSVKRRAGLRDALGVSTDADIGLHIARGQNLAGATGLPRQPAVIDTSTPHPARRYNYWLGGKDHFAADRESGDAIAAAFPTVPTGARENRAFLRRVVRYLARNGIRQFLDIGTGLPVPDNTHEIAQRISPLSRVLYVDNDPIVLTHARALLTGDPRGRTGYLQADLHDPQSILTSVELRETLSLDEPVGLLLVSVLPFLHDDNQVLAIVRQLLDALPSDSYLAVSHFTMDYVTGAARAAYQKMYDEGRADARARPEATFRQFFQGLDLIEPGIVSVNDWHPEDLDNPNRPSAADLFNHAAVGRVP
ncbi:SAM-dependent methyltransferase [Actinoplanes oblitus]|uniref:SAM-dependent methyltransferase n=1 Tax=Actinoplanes oblitus TaxID=3040509 RepID=A0ABY8WSK5_9ACTN|nr:SAM-dependent methyltransferase [Actinoplanes oblitus]WIM99976.1 SAM-dependent methyltransferase [Actinoplanes oblitus]